MTAESRSCGNVCGTLCRICLLTVNARFCATRCYSTRLHTKHTFAAFSRVWACCSAACAILWCRYAGGVIVRSLSVLAFVASVYKSAELTKHLVVIDAVWLVYLRLQPRFALISASFAALASTGQTTQAACIVLHITSCLFSCCGNMLA